MSTIGSSRSTPQSNATALVGEIDKNIKYKTIEPFTGERNKLQGFLLQLRLYVTFNGERFRSDTEQVLWAVTLLDGKAMHWIEGFLEDYLKNTNKKGEIIEDQMEDTTVKIFQTWDGFLNEIRANFGVMDERKEAERAIESLRQKGSATAYTREFQRYSTRTEWGDEALRYQYRKGLKDFVKDELLRTGHSTETLEELIQAACEIDNAWYERSMERKGKYDPDYRRMGEGQHKSSRYSRNRGDPMELDATHRREMTPQDRQKHMQDRTCFNCGKPGHMARNCKSGKHQKNFGRRELNATMTSGRGGYNGRMQLNATLRGAATDEAFEEVTQSLEAIQFVDTLGNDVSSDSSDESSDKSSIIGEMSLEEVMSAQILSGTRSAEDYQQEFRGHYNDRLRQSEDEFLHGKKEFWQLINYKTKQLDTTQDYRCLLFHIVQAVEKQVLETDDAHVLGIRRSQQYQDRLAENIDYLPRLKITYMLIKQQGEDRRQEIEEFRIQGNVARIDHPRHAELAWSFCYTDSCSIHRSSKDGSGYWPSRRMPVYWEQKTCDSSSGSTANGSQPSKN